MSHGHRPFTARHLVADRCTRAARELSTPSAWACHVCRNSMEDTHLVQCTPGSAGTMIRAG